MKEYKWWQNAVIYQIYPKSFQDSNGDGIGDLPGIIDRLDYLKELGIDGIWLSPVCQSPQFDNGYDISDYQNIDPMFGTMEDMRRLISEAKKRDIRIIFDLVLNHSSDQHPWFLEAKKGRDNPCHSFYIWRDGVEGQPPNDMASTFGGSAWEWVPELGQYYFHQFAPQQPDLNWENPDLREALYRMLNFWIAEGIGGFRLDVIDLIGKDPDQKVTSNGPKLHDYIKEMNLNTFGGTDLVTVGETWGATPELGRRYSNPAGNEFSMVFQFEHVRLDQQPGGKKWDLAPLDFRKLKQVIAKWQTELHDTGWNSLFWNNHDLPRIVSRWGNDREYREKSAKMLATVLYGLEGTPYIYQGEELGMTNARYSIEDYRDIELLNLYKERIQAGYTEQEVMRSIHAKGRDTARTPMQWDNSRNAGFTRGEPWIKVNPDYTEINAASQITDPQSVFCYYRRLIQLRKKNEIIRFGAFRLHLPEDEDLFVYSRMWQGREIFIACNFHDKEREFIWADYLSESSELLITNELENLEARSIKPYEARMYLI